MEDGTFYPNPPCDSALVTMMVTIKARPMNIVTSPPPRATLAFRVYIQGLMHPRLSSDLIDT